LTRIESSAFSSSSLKSIEIPRNVEILGSSCFCECKSLSSISFESNSRLLRIESNAFRESSLESIEIPRNVEFIDGSAFEGIKSNCVSIESGHERFSIEDNFLVDIINHGLIRNFSSSSSITICSDIEILASRCFSFCDLLSSISFESNSRLLRIDSHGFTCSSLHSIEIPRNVEILGSSCFYNCKSLSSISFESNSRLIRIESEAFHGSLLHSIEIPRNVEILGSSCFSHCDSLSSIALESNAQLKRIDSGVFEHRNFSLIVPSTIVFIACDAAPDPTQISLANFDSCPEYGRWQRLQRSKMTIDFKRICRFDSGLPSLSDCLFNLSGFSEGSQLSESDEVSTQIYEKCDDKFQIIVKSINISGCLAKEDVARSIENLMNLRHPCVASVNGVVLLSPLQGLKIVRMYLCGCSLSEVVSTSPEWWTPTAKAKAVVSLVLGLRFSHSLGLLHGHLTGNNVYLKEDGMIQITDFCINDLRQLESNPTAKVDVGGFSGESWTPKVDVQAFAELLSEIVIGPSGGQGGHDPSVPSFVLKMIARGQSADLKSVALFSDILKTLKQNDFKILENVDVAEVRNFVNWIEWAEKLTE
jgi:hypothetical protein